MYEGSLHLLINIEKFNIKASMSSFDSSSFQSKIAEITELYNQVYPTKDTFPFMTRDEKLVIIDLLDPLMKKLRDVYSNLSDYNESEAVEMKEQIVSMSENVGIPTSLNIDRELGGHDNMIRKMRALN